MSAKTDTSYKIVNPSAGNDYFNNSAGATSDGDGQPTVNKGRAANLGTSASTQSANMDEYILGDGGRNGFPTIFASTVRSGPRGGAVSANLGSAVGSVSVAASSGRARYTKTSHGLTVGSIINVSDTNDKVQGGATVTNVVSANAFDTNQAYASGAGTVDYRSATGNFALMTAAKYVILRVSDELHGVSNTKLQAHGIAYSNRRSIHKVESGFRHLAVATAIRAGYWDVFSGTFSTAASATNNSVSTVGGTATTDGTADHAATPTRSIPGELVYKASGAGTAGTAAGKGSILDDYSAKTG